MVRPSRSGKMNLCSGSFSSAHICFSVVARSNDILKKLVLEAKREYEKDAEHRVHIFMADT